MFIARWSHVFDRPELEGRRASSARLAAGRLDAGFAEAAASALDALLAGPVGDAVDGADLCMGEGIDPGQGTGPALSRGKQLIQQAGLGGVVLVLLHLLPSLDMRGIWDISAIAV